MGAKLIVGIVVEAFNGGLLDRSVHPLDLAVGPRMVGFGQQVLDPVGFANHVEAHLPGIGGVPIPWLVGELNAVVGQDRVDAVGNGLKYMLKKLPGGAPVRFVDEMGHGKLAGAVDGHEEIELALGRLHLGDVDVEETDRVALELRPLRLVALDVRQARDAMPLQAPVER